MEGFCVLPLCFQGRQRRLFCVLSLEGVAHGERDVAVVIAGVFALSNVCQPVLVAQFEAVMVGNLYARADGEARVKPLVAVFLEYLGSGLAGILVLSE